MKRCRPLAMTRVPSLLRTTANRSRRTGSANKMRQWCDDAGLPECSSHGLRKASATILAEAGATEHQLMAIFGWSDSKMAQHYTKTDQSRRIIDAGFQRRKSYMSRKNVPLSRDQNSSETKKGKNDEKTVVQRWILVGPGENPPALLVTLWGRRNLAVSTLVCTHAVFACVYTDLWRPVKSVIAGMMNQRLFAPEIWCLLNSRIARRPIVSRYGYRGLIDRDDERFRVENVLGASVRQGTLLTSSLKH